MLNSKIAFQTELYIEWKFRHGCLLAKIHATEPVAVRDEVFSLETSGGFATPLFYGTVTRAELAAGATQWEIEVRPATNPRSVRTVCVVRPMVNAKRLAN